MSTTVLPYKCHNCGEYFGPPSASCPRCGCGSWDATVYPEGFALNTAIGRPGTVAQSRTEGGERTQYTSPAGTESSSEVNDGRVTFELRGTQDVGKEGEARVIECVAGALRAQGHEVRAVVRNEEEKRDDDKHGVDGRLEVDGRPIPIQIVTAPLDCEFLAAAAKGVARTEVTWLAAARWLQQAIKSKSSHYPPDDRKSMLLAIDVRHVAVVRVIVDSNLRAEAAAAGFDAVWLVGPTTDTTVMLSCTGTIPVIA
jgi:hypothetical protein